VSRAPVAVFDSGVGGLSVLRHLRAALPDEDVLYAADAAWCPYGPRPAELVRGRVFAVVGALVDRGAKAVVVACNTASTVALAELRARWPALPIVGMEPAVKPAAERTDTGAIGVLATATTASGEALARLVDRFGRGVVVHVAVPEGLVELVERGRGDSPDAEALLRPILAGWRATRVDTVVLGCTHYPFARAALERVAGPEVAVIDPAPAVARQAVRVLTEPGLLSDRDRSGRTTFLTTGEPGQFRRVSTGLVPEGWTHDAEFTYLDV
jgi:glutamate racemase